MILVEMSSIEPEKLPGIPGGPGGPGGPGAPLNLLLPARDKWNMFTLSSVPLTDCELVTLLQKKLLLR